MCKLHVQNTNAKLAPMKHYHASLILFLLIPAGLIAQQNQVIYDSLARQQILFGPCDRGALMTFGDYADYYHDEYKHYEPQKDVMRELNRISTEYLHINIILGTWCHDSKEQVPRFLLILDEMDFPMDRLGFIFVNRLKTAGTTDISELDIELVPTFIVYEHEKELGRIVESPAQSLESDLLEIIKE